MKRHGLTLLLLLVFCLTGRAQERLDTLKVMTYNLLYYGEQTSFCTSSNNNINDKDGYLKTITDYLNPDLLLVNEMGASVVYADRIIANVLNTDGETRYRRAGIQNNSFSSLVNGIFYDKNKLAQVQHEKVTKTLNNADIVRAIDVITFYYKDPNLAVGDDTVFIHLVGMHLKAGSTSQDQGDRDVATEALMSELADNYASGYFIAAGDLNVQSSSEASYQNLIAASNGDYRFFDPIDEAGSWSNNSNFSAIHTQSTHTSGSCFSGGGLDDRFDHILFSGQIIEDTGAVKFIEGSYKTIGNDGEHFNQNLIQGTNSSVPSSVRSALYEMSDHLPVTAQISVRLQPELVDSDTIPSAVTFNKNSAWKLDQGRGFFQLRELTRGDELRIYDIFGNVHHQQTIRENTLRFSMDRFPSGVYLIQTKGAIDRVRKISIVH